MYGHLPMLARLHIGQDQAESICERVLSTANQIMETGNTLLNDEELRNVVVLRFNKAFIVKYRAKLKDRIAVKIKAQFQHAGQQKETLDALYTKNVEQAYMWSYGVMSTNERMYGVRRGRAVCALSYFNTKLMCISIWKTWFFLVKKNRYF